MNQGSSLWSDAWRRLLANKAAVAGGIILLILIIRKIYPITDPFYKNKPSRLVY